MFAPAISDEADDRLGKKGDERHDAEQDSRLPGAEALTLDVHQYVRRQAGRGCNKSLAGRQD